MDMDLDINMEKEFLRVRVFGVFELRRANECFTRMLEAVAQHGAKKVFIDCRDLTGTLSTMDRYEHAVYAERELSRIGVSRSTRFGFVAKPPVLDNERFGQTVARNRGINVKSTDNMEEALQWLERP